MSFAPCRNMSLFPTMITFFGYIERRGNQLSQEGLSSVWPWNTFGKKYMFIFLKIIHKSFMQLKIGKKSSEIYCYYTNDRMCNGYSLTENKKR